MNETTSPLFDDVKQVVVETLDLQDQADSLAWDTELLGALPGLDSMSVMLLLTALAERFDIDVEDAGFSGEAFETLGTLTAFVESATAGAA
jgi:acyl carrier protein